MCPNFRCFILYIFSRLEPHRPWLSRITDYVKLIQEEKEIVSVTKGGRLPQYVMDNFFQ